MFDRSLLPDASFEFVVIADTHHMRVPAGAPTEFESRRLQADRAETALRLAASLDCELVIHMGDLVQAYPEFEGFQSAMAEARSVINQCGLRPIVVPGNHDVGDKPDPTMPTHPVSAGSLAWFDQHVGPAWSSFDHHDVHFVVLNTMILNSDMPQAGEQRQWLESDLRKQAGRRTFMFLHLPPYVGSENEPGLGHYDNVDQPDRRWLLDLVKTHEIELLVAAHVHWRFFDRIGNTRYFVAPSPSFTRPGFGHLFASAPAPEQGRDDAPKLGFFLTRVSDAHIDMHLIRTNGLTRIAPAIADGRVRHLLTRHSRALPDSPLGLTLQQPLGPRTDLPLAWPSNVRQPVRNDYPLLACVELGVRHVRVPCTDLADTEQRRSLQMLRDEGVSLIATSLRGDGQDALEWMGRCGDQIDAWEIQVPGGRPGDELLEQIRQLKRRGDTPVVLSPVIPKEHVAGKQHLRTRHAYWLEELDDLDERLRDAGLNVDRVLCRPEPDADLIDTFARIGSASARQAIGAIDVQIELNTVDEARSLRHAATAVFAARSAALHNDLDRMVCR